MIGKNDGAFNGSRPKYRAARGPSYALCFAFASSVQGGLLPGEVGQDGSATYEGDGSPLPTLIPPKKTG